MAINPKFAGRSYGPYRYVLGLEKMREFAFAIGGGYPNLGVSTPPAGLNPLLYDEVAAKAGPYGEVIAFPSFCVTFAMAPFGDAVMDPELEVNLVRLVHGEQEFEFFDVMRAGDVMTTTGTLTKLFSKAGMDFLTVVSESRNQHSTLVVKGTWTAVLRS